ncbi:MAG: hypothetical protein HG422_06970 [Prevotella sp.]|nr:hypothetical protein [Prevotella sp.]
MNSKMKYGAPYINIVSVKTDDVMQGFVVTSFSIPSGEAKKGFMMDEEEEDNAATVNGKAIGGYTNWEEQ